MKVCVLKNIENCSTLLNAIFRDLIVVERECLQFAHVSFLFLFFVIACNVVRIDKEIFVVANKTIQ